MRDDAHTEMARPHEGGIEVQMLDAGAVRFVRLDGTTLDSSVPVPSGNWIQLPLQHQRDGIHITAETAATRWAGERCDYGLGVEVLMSRHKRAREAALAKCPDVSHGGVPLVAAGTRA